MIGSGLQGRLLAALNLILTGRCHRIKLDNCLSSKAELPFGGVQGSVLGPLHFILYTTPPISEHTISPNFYADDSHLYVSFALGDSAAALNGLQSCLSSVQSWMSMKKVKHNPDNTDFLLIENE